MTSVIDFHAKVKRPTWILNSNTIHGYIRESVFMYVYIYLSVI